MAKSRRKSLTYDKKLIFSSSPPQWRFFDFGRASTDSEIQRWYDALSDRGKFLFDSMLKANRDIDLSIHWVGWRHFLRGVLEGQGVWELGFFDEVQHRILGFFGPERKTAIFLIGCTHKGRVYEPPSTLNTAKTRKKQIMDGEAIAIERQIRTDF